MQCLLQFSLLFFQDNFAQYLTVVDKVKIVANLLISIFFLHCISKLLWYTTSVDSKLESKQNQKYFNSEYNVKYL